MDKKKLIEGLTIKSNEIRKIIIETVSKNGGHIGPNLGVVELTLAIHSIFNSPKDKILFDVGHQSYVHKLLTGRKDKFSTLRQRHGIGPFTDRAESPHDHFISGHAGSALSAGFGIATADKGNKVIVVIGDASIANGHSLEALNNMDGKCENLIVILNDNEMSIGNNVGALSKFFSRVMGSKFYLDLKDEVEGMVRRGKIGNKIADIIGRVEHGVKTMVAPVSMSEFLGFKYVGPVDGHSFEELLPALEKAKNLKGPIFLHIKTHKGKGYLPAEKNPEKFHGISPFDIKSGETPKGEVSYSKIFGDKLVEMGENNSDIYALCCGMVKGTGLSGYFDKFKERSYDMGIAEGHTVTFAGGLATQGKIPYVAIYSTFLQRAYGQLIHDISIQNLSVNFILDRAGIVGEDGKTHQGLYDIPYLLTIPNINILAPTTKKELEEILEFSSTYKDGPLSIRIPRDSAWDYNSSAFEFGKWKEIEKGNDTLILAVGSMVKEVVNIAEELKTRGISPTIVGVSSIRPLDEEYIEENFKKYKNIITLEEGRIKSGFGSFLLEMTNSMNIYRKIFRLGIECDFIPHGKRGELLEEFGLRGRPLVNDIERCINAKY
ncbi:MULTISPECIES: 1-deoxy-D-xylulose-5-phosphate synthase [Psychrilyobacter]|uniref:1-deoxy-D-xylulose-5-phosphate synthase n=1 Tax=Psychrilyobacter piezotolerans TaxID=2293438 RepID=A0ABX9KLV8_9FUSO|nr:MULTISPECIES: 1-deoxy-D-xylulose-5-phosphate synthase [Psychrilyobacter]MCS5422603.1 1-deoxy-D-xylulose-5-phosphate synthase [Psychrilyobacter sp. S5]NDI76551.1 1-deoxy-D-xylulose-5-phosphate synthase [Psychrilyobacter piezotolerans]RDE66142.1 1-deoxy-D-xylulose-5-phosphate synthase [Psychrilyobacter sp. S5]REI43320.1 1-deoxy-D-xylulose-5-phosphate synthase [Psychrilyobacter piezotolerans]